MADIARAVGLSRPAVYLHYQNKQDIYRSLIQHYFDVTEARVSQALVPGMAPEDALSAVFAAKAGPELEAMFASAHGEELLDANVATSADLVEAGESRIAAHLARWLQTEAEAGRIVLPDAADVLARTLIAAQTGLKSPRLGFAAYRSGAARLASLIGRGLRA
jgi:AcrR family transcriptional regulator